MFAIVSCVKIIYVSKKFQLSINCCDKIIIYLKVNIKISLVSISMFYLKTIHYIIRWEKNRQVEYGKRTVFSKRLFGKVEYVVKKD